MATPVPHKVSLGFLAAYLLASLSVAPVATPAPANGPMEESPDFRSNVNLVSLYFNVKDERNLAVRQLSKDDFVVTDNGRPQLIRYFSAEASQPLTLGVLVDTSIYVKAAIAMEQETAGEFLQRVLRQNDRACIVAFNNGVVLVQEFTDSAGMLLSALRKTYGGMGVPSIVGAPDRDRILDMSFRSGNAHLRDAVALTARKKRSAENGRKAMIVLTDGEDDNSRETVETSIRAAQEADAVVYVILFKSTGESLRARLARARATLPPGFFGKPEDLTNLTRQTGGRVIGPGADRAQMKEAFAEIAAELHSQYYIGYTPADTNFDGKFHKIEIRTGNPAYRVQSRTGYYATKHGN